MIILLELSRIDHIDLKTASNSKQCVFCKYQTIKIASDDFFYFGKRSVDIEEIFHTHILQETQKEIESKSVEYK